MASGELETATFAGGCFWCVEPIFADLTGVEKVVPGYSGGHVPNPTYGQVCTGSTGHAESVQVTFDPRRIGYPDLLEVLFAVHDPTTKDRQGHDVGSQYRSVIFYHSQEQRAAAEAALATLARDPGWEGPRAVTEVAPMAAFYPAEDHHAEYFERNPTQSYCRVVIAPKVAKFRKRFAGKLAQGPTV